MTTAPGGLRNVLAVIGDPAGGRASLEAAIRVGRHLNCHVEAMHVRSDPTATLPLVGEAMSGAMVDEMMGVANKEAGQRANKTRAIYDEILARENIVDAPSSKTGFAVSWLDAVGVEEQVVALRGCRADLIVVARPTPENETAALMTLNAALMQSGRAVLAAPPIPADGNIRRGAFKKIALFWNGSTEATRAVQAAMPFLAKAEEVIVLRVEEEEWYAETDDLEAHLAYHGVHTIVSKVLPREGKTGRSLLFATGDVDADMMVMGAYTRSKMRQLILGSVTGYVMQHAILPVLLCH
ncbi:MAG: universal stress protein [Alphaproteobacteria bacterium]|nr:universal stress protein [Alphaproteobacteria bacterium]